MGERARGIAAAAVAGATALALAVVVIALTLTGAAPFTPSPGSGQEGAAARASARRAHPPTTTTGDDGIEVAGIVVEAPTSDTALPPGTTAPAAAPAAPAAPIRTADPAPVAEPEPAAEPQPAPCPAFGGSGVAGIVGSHRSVRCRLGLPDVALDPAMNVHAQFHAERLMAEGACSSLWHSSELGSWYPAGFWGENAACMSWSKGCWSDAGPVVDGWMGSPTHRPNIVKPEYRHLGVGIACDGQRTYFVVHLRS